MDEASPRSFERPNAVALCVVPAMHKSGVIPEGSSGLCSGRHGWVRRFFGKPFKGVDMQWKQLLRRGLVLGALAASLGAQAQGPSFSSLVVFGDGLADSGNSAQLIGADPGQVVSGDGYYAVRPFATGRYTNGRVWVEDLASRFGLRADPSMLGGSNYAYGGGATSDGVVPGASGYSVSMRSQLTQYLGTLGTPGAADPSQTLFVLSGGSVNVGTAMEAAATHPDQAAAILGAAAQGYASDIHAMVDAVQAAGGRHILVVNAANFGLTPRAQSYGPQVAGLGSFAAALMNQALNQSMLGESGVQLFDLYGTLTDVIARPGDFGFSNVSHACAAVQYGCDTASALFYDGQHPTAFGHQLIANRVYAALVPEPAAGLQLIAGLGGLLLLGRWRRRQQP